MNPVQTHRYQPQLFARQSLVSTPGSIKWDMIGDSQSNVRLYPFRRRRIGRIVAYEQKLHHTSKERHVHTPWICQIRIRLM